jgi:hypothetical protein
MTKERAKVILSLITAFVEGKVVEYWDKELNKWMEPIDGPDFWDDCIYRFQPNKPREFWLVKNKANEVQDVRHNNHLYKDERKLGYKTALFCEKATT